MWTTESRARYDRSKLRCPSDLTDEEWAVISPLIPFAELGGNKRTVNMREVVNGLMYILGTGCQCVLLQIAGRAAVGGRCWATTLFRWVQAYAGELEQRVRRHLRPCTGSWRLDETYIEVKGVWA